MLPSPVGKFTGQRYEVGQLTIGAMCGRVSSRQPDIQCFVVVGWFCEQVVLAGEFSRLFDDPTL
jgi:hypothetical protein